MAVQYVPLKVNFSLVNSANADVRYFSFGYNAQGNYCVSATALKTELHTLIFCKLDQIVVKSLMMGKYV